jgi:hypothetical protein
MLQEFFDFLKSRHGYTFLHWNMRDINYGFQAIEHRFRVLGGEPFVVDDTRKYDLARLLVSIYGVSYIGHKPSGRLHNLIELNGITERDILTGADEAAAFEQKDFVKLHQSTLRKVDVIANIFERLVDGSLKTNATWWSTHGAHPMIVLEVITKHWVWLLFAAIATVVAFVSRVKGLF